MEYKRYFALTLATLHSGLHTIPRHDFKVTLESKWKNLEDETNNDGHITNFDGKWILAGSITFKKISKECINLHKLVLQWHGPHMQTMTASLYHKKPDKEFRPLQDFLVCDGIWHKKNQTLLLNFEKQCTLACIDTFYLVLTIPPAHEKILQQGSFSLANHCLPEHFDHYLIENKLSLSCNDIKK